MRFDICGFQSIVVRLAVLADALGNDLAAAEESPTANAEKVITSRACRSPVTFNEWVNPIHSPERIGRELDVSPIVPVLVNGANKLVHQMRNVSEVGRYVAAHVNRLLSKPAT